MTEPEEIAALRRDIVARFRTVHRFCRSTKRLNRSTVYMVLSGRYGGNSGRQAARIREVLEEGGEEKRMFEAIKKVACCRCPVSGACARCDALFQDQARAVLQAINY